MMNTTAVGFGWLMVAAFCSGVFPLPLRLRKRYALENTMLIAMGVATLIAPTLVATCLLPQWPSVIAAAGWATLAKVMLFGVGWGCATAAFGLGVSAVGVSLSYPLIMGVNIMVGSTLPMLSQWSNLPTGARVLLVAGATLIFVGMALSGKAGAGREKHASLNAPSTAHSPRSYMKGVAWCIASGAFCACANLGFHYARPIGDAARAMGMNPVYSTIPQWLPIYWSGYAALLLWFGRAIYVNQSMYRFWGPGSGRDMALAAGMGMLHVSAQLPYGIGAYYLGPLGTSIGWAFTISTSILAATGAGLLVGEWRGAPHHAVRLRNTGLAVIVLAMVLLAWGNVLTLPEA